MEPETKKRLEEVLKKLGNKYENFLNGDGLSKEEYTRKVNESIESALNGEGLEELISFLLKAGVSEKQLLEALEYIEQNGIKKYIKSIYEKCAEMYQKGFLIKNIEDYLNKTKLSDDVKSKIIEAVKHLDKNLSNIKKAGKEIYGIYDKGKKLAFGMLAVVLFLVASVAFLLIREFSR